MNSEVTRSYAFPFSVQPSLCMARADNSFLAARVQAEARLVQEFRRPNGVEIRQGIGYAVTPLFTATITVLLYYEYRPNRWERALP